MAKITLKPNEKKGGRPKKYGAYRFLRTGIIPEHKEYIADMADAAIGRMAEDLGGLANISGTQIAILREVRQLMIYKFIVDERLMEEGLFKPGADVELQAPLNAFYLSCCNSIIRACNLLGLKKVSAVENLDEYLTRKYPAESIESTKTKDTGQREIAPQRG